MRGVLGSGGRLVFGGHPSVTPLMHRVVSQAGFRPRRIDFLQLERSPPEVNESTFKVSWIDSEDLGPLREEMARRSRAGVFVGGKTSGFIGEVPGKFATSDWLALAALGAMVLILRGDINANAMRIGNGSPIGARRHGMVPYIRCDTIDWWRWSLTASASASSGTPRKPR